MIPLLLAAAAAHASAFYFVDAGTRSLGRGAAFVAGVDDLSAQYYNNAGLIRLDRPQAYLNVSSVTQFVSFERKDYDIGGNLVATYDPVQNEGPPLVIPSFGLSLPFQDGKTVGAIGFYPPYAPDMLYPEDGAQRYSLVDSLVWQLYGGPSVAHRFTPWLTVGVGLVWTLVRAEEKLVLTTCAGATEFTCNDDEAAGDVAVSLAAWDPARFTGSLGLLVEPTDWLAIGGSFMPPIKVRARGTVALDFNEDHLYTSFLDGTHFEDTDVTVLLTMPMIIRLGAAVHPMDKLEVELTGVYQGWHVEEEITVTDVDLTLDVVPDGFIADDIVVTDDILLPAGFDDSYSARLGAEYDVNRSLTARAGGYYETSAVPMSSQGVAIVDGNKYGYGVGATWRQGEHLAIDLAWSQSFLANRDIKDSDVAQIALAADLTNPSGVSADVVDGKIVGNGNFESRLSFLSAGATVYWGGASGD